MSKTGGLRDFWKSGGQIEVLFSCEGRVHKSYFQVGEWPHTVTWISLSFFFFGEHGAQEIGEPIVTAGFCAA